MFQAMTVAVRTGGAKTSTEHIRKLQPSLGCNPAAPARDASTVYSLTRVPRLVYFNDISFQRPDIPSAADLTVT